MVETVDTLVAYYRKQILTLHIVFLLLLCMYVCVFFFNRWTVTVVVIGRSRKLGFRKILEKKSFRGKKQTQLLEKLNDFSFYF